MPTCPPEWLSEYGRTVARRLSQLLVPFHRLEPAASEPCASAQLALSHIGGDLSDVLWGRGKGYQPKGHHDLDWPWASGGVEGGGLDEA